MRVFVIGIIGFFFSATVAFAADCTEQFSWKPNAETDIAGYKIHYGLTSGGPYTHSVDVGKLPTIGGRILTEVPSFSCGNYYYVVATAYNSVGEESDYSTQVGLLITAPSDESYPVIKNIISE
ncbi:hypothetical protein [Desulfosediminicola flagellatus]|uniref:hypothetical protein n=1 Tax=Desulfosediminicola flagellatus TaxID=2569541 RepID=UPI0010AB7268|nr:hypothetical protein [Desulfosediminicola flagellatus]